MKLGRLMKELKAVDRAARAATKYAAEMANDDIPFFPSVGWRRNAQPLGHAELAS